MKDCARYLLLNYSPSNNTHLSSVSESSYQSEHSFQDNCSEQARFHSKFYPPMQRFFHTERENIIKTYNRKIYQK